MMNARTWKKVMFMLLSAIVLVTIIWYNNDVIHTLADKNPRGVFETWYRRIVPVQEEAVGMGHETPWEVEQQKRKAAIREGCGGKPTAAALSRTLQKSPILPHLLIDDVHKAIYCFIPKVSSTSFKKVWLSMINPDKGKGNRRPHAVLNAKIRQEKRQKTNLRQKLSTYTKYLIVRHPFERLLSAYKNKIKGPQKKFQQKTVYNYAKKIRPNVKRSDIQWTEFVDYLNNGGDRKNRHWNVFARHCYLCSIEYDIVGKYETLGVDSEHFLRRVRAPEWLHFPEYHPTKTSSELQKYMRNLTKMQIDRLYRTYEKDFRLFQYTYNPH
ncbi:carbohydrate sulfotransferase 11-like isoform X1 [Homarus americanus]|uniref:carbohydrate sulfotransferase 11-like isoform X1 n=1 Tax=Homarus americanus TaxID=6706 RepID=UPI001C44DE7A|nr:carbohydrate sulfotransferase 11-like isoform X1 [Homarus americanus]